MSTHNRPSKYNTKLSVIPEAELRNTPAKKLAEKYGCTTSAVYIARQRLQKVEDTKQVIVVRKDLNMRRGKECAQVAHASMAFLTRRMQASQSKASRRLIDLLPGEEDWLKSSFRKIVVTVNSQEELEELHTKATANGLESHIITDNGTTEFGGVPTMTCLAVGPDYEHLVDAITGNLPLY